ncbi:MAG: PHP-like protein [Burkholderiales bacterium]|nr:PHP-like protein [Burkholderiales bacterium]
MNALEAISKQPAGASFFRADLHVHCFGGSHDVTDPTMTPEAVVATAVKENLSLVAIADHNEIASVERALAAANGTSVLVVPAIELSTGQGHLLCYFPSLTVLRRFHGQLTLVDSGSPTSRCQQSMLECLNLTNELGGFGLLAHVDAPSGFEVHVPGSSPHKADIICHPALLGMELKAANSLISYGPTDPDVNRGHLGNERIRRLGLGSKQNLARVLNSDAHTLAALGRNAENAQKVTRYKMDEPGFHALRIALEDADARVRIEDLVPSRIPSVIGLQIDGGFLANQTIRFSPNLNCIIGGRGTGKSTTFEAVRCLIEDGEERNQVVDSDVWPEELNLVWRDKAAQEHSLFRLKGGEVENLDAPDAGPTSFDIDCFGQGEAAKISAQAQSNPLALLHYLDRFVDVNQALAEETTVREKLLKLQTDIEAADQKVQLIPQHERLLAITKQQLTALQKPDVKELIALQRKLATEKEVRTQVTDLLALAKRESASLPSREAVKDIRELGDPAQLVVGGAEFRAILAGASELEVTVSTAETDIKGGLAKFEKVVTAQMAQWKSKETEAQKKIDAKRRELEALKISFDMSYIAKLAKDEATHEQSVKNLKSWVPHLADLRNQRAAALLERWRARDKVAALRDAFGRTASRTLQEALSDLNVSLKYAASAYSIEAADLIIEAMGWRTNQQQRATWLVKVLTLPALLTAVGKKDAKPLLAIRTPEDVQVFKSDEAQLILERLGERTVLYALERVALHDLPRLQVTKKVVGVDGSERFVRKDFSKLSLGQQQSVLLALMLSADTDRPLIIDQPEDNLDGEFIYSTLVPVLRRAKERRQVIIVTHNANVAVLGDAEQIVVMKAANDRGEIVARGSIDHQPTRDAACAILEGAKEAFLRRAKMYGMAVS